MLGISPRAVHDRAHAALAVLAPAQARELTAARRAEIGDYLLGQRDSVADRVRARTYLSGSEPARAWALALASELSGLGDVTLPEIPSGNAPASDPAAGLAAGQERLRAAAESTVSEPSPPHPARQLRSSRLGGALLLAAILVIVVVVVVIVEAGGSSSKHATTATTTTTTAAKKGPTETARIPLRSPHLHSRSVGVMQIISEGTKRAFYVVAEHLPPTHGFFYALWLRNSAGGSIPLGRAPAVGANQHLEGGRTLPSTADEFQEVLLTRETSTHATHPGRVILEGPFTVEG